MLFDRSSLLRSVGLYFDKDGGSGGAQDPEDLKTDDGAGGDDAGKAGKKETEIVFTPEQEKLIGKRLREAREKEREKAKADIEAEGAKAKKEAEDAALAKNQEWQTLAEKRAADLADLAKEKAELEPFKEQAERYKKALDDQLAKVKEKLPKYLLPLIEKMDPVEAMAYITEHAEELGAKPGTYGETPEGKERKLNDKDKQEAQKASSTLITRTF
jgi:small-conductance mechanosensitive channel